MALGAMLLFTGISHLTFARREFIAQVPKSLPLSDDTVVFVIGAEPGAPFEVTAAERAELAEAGVPANPA